MNTPGPYPLDYEYESSGRIVIRTAQGSHYASTYDPQAARLIVAAPELLEALQEMFALFEAHEQYDDDSAAAVKLARLALTKATNP